MIADLLDLLCGQFDTAIFHIHIDGPDLPDGSVTGQRKLDWHTPHDPFAGDQRWLANTQEIADLISHETTGEALGRLGRVIEAGGNLDRELNAAGFWDLL